MLQNYESDFTYCIFHKAMLNKLVNLYLVTVNFQRHLLSFFSMIELVATIQGICYRLNFMKKTENFPDKTYYPVIISLQVTISL